MINTSKIVRTLGLNLAAAGFVLAGGYLQDVSAQTRDPFSKPGWAKTKEARVGGTPSSTGAKRGPKGELLTPGAPGIEQRIEYYKRLRESAAASGQPIPKVTSVLTLNELAVTGIFRTPRGYAAMVEAVPIKLSYTIYPGDKFFDGQLVAVEENRLVFRRVTKLGKGKFVSSVENKSLRQYTDQQVVQGTAPVQTEARASEPAMAQPQPTTPGVEIKNVNAPIISPLDEMNQMPADPAKDKPKNSKKPVKVAKNS